jgi:exodeoxyribonuclease V alpha subunit
MPSPSAPAPHSSDTLCGIVERVTFHSEESGYCILKVQPDGRPKSIVTVIGHAPHVVPGEQLVATGSWEQTRDYGAQFKAQKLTLKRPDTLAGIERYLGSGLIDGVGPAYAKRIIEKFGTDTLNIIEHESARLEQVEGIGSKRRQEIRASWIKQKAVHSIMLFLHQHGISPARALRLYKTYGDSAEAVLLANPYQLATDIHGIGFKTADAIATRVGMAKDATQRLQAGLLYALTEAANRGHACLPQHLLLPHSAQLLDVPETALTPPLQALLAQGQLVAHHVSDQPVISLPHLRAAEQSIAQHLLALAALPAPDFRSETEIDHAIATAQQSQQLTLADSQRHAVHTAMRQRVLIITGGPGVGKTTLVRTLLSIHQAAHKKIVLAAPTGRAARRLQDGTGLEAKTLHRLLESQGNGEWGRHRSRPLQGDVFVLDEVSMIDAALMAQFLSALPEGAQLLLVGDADQLPSVGPGKVLQDAIASDRIPCVQLTEIFRQAASSRIITSAHAINRGNLPDLKPCKTSDFFFIESPTAETITDTIVQLVKHRLPTRYGFDPVTDIQVLTPMNRNALGTHALNHALQAALNPPNEFKYEIERFNSCFRVGDKVLQTLNDYDKDVFNGDLGLITSMDLDPIKVHVRFDGGRDVVYEPGELDALQPAYAMTIHKSQGSEFPCVVIPISTQHFVMLERSLIYTAITRARQLVVLVGDPKALQLAVQKQASRRRWTSLAELLTTPPASQP